MLTHANERLDAISAVAADQIAQINAWAEQARKQHEDDAAFFSALLTEYLRTIVEPELQQHLDAGLDLEAAWKQVKTKGHPLPLGRLQARIVGGNVRVENKEALVTWAIESKHDELLKRDAAPVSVLKDKVIVKDGAVYFDGEAVPGVIFEPKSIKYGPS